MCVSTYEILLTFCIGPKLYKDEMGRHIPTHHSHDDKAEVYKAPKHLIGALPHPPSHTHS